MSQLTKACLMGGTILSLSTANASAQDAHIGHTHHKHDHSKAPSAPLHIMGDHTHNKGDWMVSYKASRMNMTGNRQGTNNISPTDIVTTLTNPNAPPANVRVVPTKMDMDMHMLGAMYGVTDKLTVMAMAMYMKNTMEHLTFAGMAGTTELGRFTTRANGWGDSHIGGIYKLYETPTHTINTGLSISIPTGSIKEEDTVLTPMNTTPTLRLPYAMQLGSGTWDAMPSLTYTGHADKWSWGAQARATIRLEDENSQDYRLGHKGAITAWGGYEINNSLSVSAHIEGQKTGKIKGADAQITAPVQTANPDNYGGESIDIGAGFSYKPQNQAIKGLEFSAQISTPIYQNVNGVQMDRDWNITTGLTYRF
ncbi:MAG: transporter [Alphaproteobacteria bacterium]